jgi:hypothetical protein
VAAVVRLVNQQPHACKEAGLARKRKTVQVALSSWNCCGARSMCVYSRSNGVRGD